MPRRGSNIYKRKDGRFEGRVPIGHKEDGSLKYKFVYARTLSEVKEKMAQFQAVLQSQPVSALKLTVAEASRQWLSAAKLRVKPSSIFWEVKNRRSDEKTISYCESHDQAPQHGEDHRE